MKSTLKRFLSLVLCMFMVMALLPNVTMTAFAATSGTVTGLADENIGLSFTGDADDAWSANGTSITGAATSTGGTCGDTPHKSTLTITNKKSTTATLSFDYTIEQNSGTIQVDGKEVSSGASFTKELAASESVKVYIKSGSTTATKITMTNVALVSDVTATATFVPAENGTYTIVSREKYDAVQAEMARRNAAKSPSKNAVTGMASYASKYALSERLVCGECGTLYRRCTWTRNGEKRVVWRCVSRLDYGKKYCHNSPTLDEAPLQQAILAALNTVMADKNSLIRQITDAMETEIIPFPGGTMSLGDIERRLRELEQQFQTLLEKATDDPAAYGGQFKEILDEQTFLKEKRAGILADNSEQAKANQRILDAAQTLENASPHITEWDESAVRQLVETVKILSKDEVAVTLKGGIEICQKIMY